MHAFISFFPTAPIWSFHRLDVFCNSLRRHFSIIIIIIIIIAIITLCSLSQVQSAVTDDLNPFPAFPVCMSLMLLAQQKKAALPVNFLMLCCTRLSHFDSISSGHPELQGTTVLNHYAACAIGACARIMSKMLPQGTAMPQPSFHAFIGQILPKLIQSQFFDAAVLVSSTQSMFLTEGEQL
jgi:hypothetical protein